jgi:hypothetical protein
MSRTICPELKAARESGALTYYTGKPCKHGHDSPRRTSTRVCVQCGIEIHYPKDLARYRTNNTLYRQYLSRKQVAKTKSIPFSIEFADIEQPTHCPVLGIELEYGWSGENTRLDNKATLDKVIPSLGYVPGNVYVISWRANKLKSDLAIDELEAILKYMKEKSNGQSL